MKWIKVLGVLAVVVVFAGIVGIAMLPNILGRRVERQLAAIKARGEPVTCAELAANIPDEENGAVVYAKAFAIIDDPEAEKELKAAFDVLSFDKRENDPELWSKARQAADRYREALIISEHAVSKPECRFPVNWGDGAYNAAFPHLGKIRSIGKLAAMTALVDAHDGKMDQAIRWVALGYRISESVKDEPTVISQMVGSACASYTSRALEDCPRYGDIDEAQVMMLSDILRDMDPSQGYHTALLGERAMGIDFLEQLRVDPTSLGRSRSYADVLCYLNQMEDYIERANRPYRALSKADKEEPNLPSYAMGTSIVYPILPTSAYSYTRDQHTARIAGDRIFLAALAHKKATGSYPGKLVELKSRLGGEIPTDPFSGRDFVYRREGKGFVLYSVGRDLTDNSARSCKLAPAPAAPSIPGMPPPPPGPATPLAPTAPQGYDYRCNGRLYSDIVWRMER